MPLQKGSSPATISKNISEFHTGPRYAHTAAKFGKADADRQAVAVAMSEAKGRAFGGVAPQMMNPGGMMSQAFNPVMPQQPGAAVPSGVMPNPAMQPPNGLAAGSPGVAGSRGFAFGGAASHATPTFKGPIVSAVPGRTDKHFTHVPSGSYVIPADVVSAHGEGNTLAGMEHLQKFFKMGQHAGPAIGGHGGIGQKLSKGGGDKHVGKPVPVKLAGGEIVVPPENVHETMQRANNKKMSLEEAHQAMDAWVVTKRKKLRKTLAKLPGPARD